MFFKNLLRNWDWVDHPPTLLGTIPKFDRFFILKDDDAIGLNLCRKKKVVLYLFQLDASYGAGAVLRRTCFHSFHYFWWNEQKFRGSEKDEMR